MRSMPSHPLPRLSAAVAFSGLLLLAVQCGQPHLARADDAKPAPAADKPAAPAPAAPAEKPAPAAEKPAAPAAPAAEQPAAPQKLAEFTRWIIAADVTADGGTILTAGGESLLYRPGDVVIWKADGTRAGDLPGHPTAVWSVKISKDGKLAATAGYDGLVKLWDLPARTLKADLKKHKGWVRSLDFAPDGGTLATAGEDGTVILWNTADGKEKKTVTAHAGPVTSVAFAADGKVLASGGGDKLVKVWNAADGAEKGKLEGHGDTIWSVAFSPDGSKLASAGADRTIRLWTTSDLKPAATLSGHKDWVTSVDFTTDGTRLVSGSLDGAVKLWDVNAKGEQEGPTALKSSVWCVTFTPDAKSIFVATHAGGQLIPTPAAKLLPPPPAPPSPPPAPAPAPAAQASAGFTTLVPTEFKSTAGASGAIAKDGIVMVTGPLGKDLYTLKAALPPGGDLKAIRLEVLPDPSLPTQGPGRAANGNFVVSTFAVKFGPPGSQDAATPVKIASAKADFSQGGFDVAGAIDDKADTGWAIMGGMGKEHVATFELAPEAKVPGGAALLITLDQQYADGTHSVGKFRLAVMQAAPAAATKAEPPKAAAPPKPAEKPAEKPAAPAAT
jgi:hypothetical protein